MFFLFTKKLPKPFIGFEPMTYALPWRYSTTELKRQFKKLLKTNINRVCDKKDRNVNLGFINYKINYEFT